MSMKSVLLGALMALCWAAPVYAADAVVVDQPPEAAAPSPNWSGAYIQGILGYESLKGDFEHQNVNNFGGPGGTYSNDGNGFIGGVAAGYNYEFSNNLVVGAELGIRSGTKADDGGEWAKYNNYTASKLSYLVTAKAVIGYDAGKFMPYVTGGYAGGKVEASQLYTPQNLTWSDSEFRSGYVVGAGAKVRITDHWFAGVEYNYVDLGKASFGGNDSSGRLTQIDGKFKSNSVFATIGYKF